MRRTRAASRARAVLAVARVGTESRPAWQQIVDDLKAREVQQIALAVTDGDEAAINVWEHAFPFARCQRCLTHKLRHILAKTAQAGEAGGGAGAAEGLLSVLYAGLLRGGGEPVVCSLYAVIQSVRFRRMLV